MNKNNKKILVIIIAIIIVTIVVIISINVHEKEKKSNQKQVSISESIEKEKVYQKTYKINKYNDTTMQIREYMEDFEIMCTSYLGIEIDDREGYLKGESTTKLPIPIEESIYLEERAYTKTYTVNNEFGDTEYYDIKFYKEGDNLVAEFEKQ